MSDKASWKREPGMVLEVPIGLLYSTTGTYQAMGREALDGALLGLHEVNNDPGIPFSFIPTIENPCASIDNYRRMCEKLLREQKCKHVIGTITSISRKEVIPIIEKHDALLWYCCPYEGFECCDNVIYLGASPNQQVIPLFRYLIPKYGNRGYFLGSNYIWGWEQNRIGRELLHACGGETLGEKYLAFDDVDSEHLIAEIREKRPDFIFNNLVGTSSYAFYKAYARAGKTDPFFTPSNCPIVSCNLIESELPMLGPEAGIGHISTASYFDALETRSSLEFKQTVAASYGEKRYVSSYMVNGYSSIKLLASAIVEAGNDNVEQIKQVLFDRSFDSPLGSLQIDSGTNHAGLHPIIAEISERNKFRIRSYSEEQVSADPYLVEFDPGKFADGVNQLAMAPPPVKVVK